MPFPGSPFSPIWLYLSCQRMSPVVNLGACQIAECCLTWGSNVGHSVGQSEARLRHGRAQREQSSYLL